MIELPKYDTGKFSLILQLIYFQTIPLGIQTVIFRCLNYVFGIGPVS